jgi:hypothetical protein
MMLHHEALVAVGTSIPSMLVWGALTINAAVFYLRRIFNWRTKMPCWSKQTSTIAFGENTDRALFEQALRTMGYTVRVQQNGDITFRDGESLDATLDMKGSLKVTAAEGTFDVNTLKRAYSTEVVKSAAKRFGWQAKQTENKFVVQRRY